MTDHFEVTRPALFLRSLLSTLFGVARRALYEHQSAFLVFPLAAIVSGGMARADLVAQYAFTGTTLNRSATTVAANVTAGNITDAPTVNGNQIVTLIRTGGDAYGAAAGPVLSASRTGFNESLVRANVYFTLMVLPNAGYELDLSSLTFNVAQGGGTALTRDYDIRTSLDSFATSLTGIVLIPTVRSTFTPVSINLSGAPFQDLVSPITFQFRFFAGPSQNIDFDDITLNGTVAATAVPESSTLPVLAIIGCWMFRRRQCEA